MKTKNFIAGLFISLIVPACAIAQNCDTIFLDNWHLVYGSTVSINNDTFTFPNNGVCNAIDRWVHIDSINTVDSLLFHYRVIPLSDSAEIEIIFADTAHWGGFDWNANIVKNDSIISFRIFGTPDCLDNFYIHINQLLTPFTIIAPKLLIFRRTNTIEEIPFHPKHENSIGIYNILGQPANSNTKNTLLIFRDEYGNTKKKIIIR